MCFATLAAAGTALAASAAAAAPTIGAVGSVVSAGGAVLGGIAAGNAASYQAQVAENNAQIAKQNAQYALQAGQAKQEQEGLKAAERAAEVKTSMAANNVDVNTGSAVDVEAGTREKGVLDSATVANNAELQAYGYQTTATGFEAQAGLDRATAAEAPIGAAIGATGSLLSNASSVGFKWTGGDLTGANGGSPYTNRMNNSGFSEGGA